MPKFFLNRDALGPQVILDGEDARHLSRSLRARVGELVTLADGEKNDYTYRITGFTRETVELEFVESHPSEAEPKLQVTLFIGCAKGDKTEVMIQKAVECGAVRIVPFISQNCIARPERGKKVDRWNKVSLEAAKQSGRAMPPVVDDVVSYKEAVAMAAAIGGAILYEHEEIAFGTYIQETLGIGKKQEIAFLIGSEGGFTPKEVEEAKMAGLASLSLGKRVLRCESVPAFLLGAVLALTEEI